MLDLDRHSWPSINEMVDDAVARDIERIKLRSAVLGSVRDWREAQRGVQHGDVVQKAHEALIEAWDAFEGSK